MREKFRYDPYFRGGDIWRLFYITSLFTEETIEITRDILQTEKPNGQLVSLMLEMLEKSPAAATLEEELCTIILNSKVRHSMRERALRCLLNCGCMIKQSGYQQLLKSGAAEDLIIATSLQASLIADNVNLDGIVELLQATSVEYSLDYWEARYFIRRNICEIIERLNRVEIEYLLDNFTKQIRCKCGSSLCECRYASSKIACILLDHFIDRYQENLDAVKIWSWTENLRFRNGKSSKDSKSVEILCSKPELRQEIHKLVLGNVSDYSEVKVLWHPWLTGHMHTGLYLQSEDLQAIVDFAFQSNNVGIWEYFIVRHDYYSREQGPNALRRHMREQANTVQLFMRPWQRVNRKTKALYEEWRNRPSRENRRYNRREKQTHIANARSLAEDRDAIRAGSFGGGQIISQISTSIAQNE